MSALTKALSFHYASHKMLQIIVCLAVSLLLFGCASSPKMPIHEESFSFVTDMAKPKSIFVFMDGTGNNPNIPTNVYRLYHELNNNNDKQTVANYIEGVGNTDSPIAGQAVGFGMEDRILLGYAFITKQYHPGDRIYLFGFSRGAHTARSLAGLISYAGVPKVSDVERENKDTLIKIGDGLIEMTKNVRESDFVDDWKKWQLGDKPLLAESIFKKKGKEVQPAEVKFLGVWDTVPGSEFKNDEYFENSDIACEESLDWKKTTPVVKEIAYWGSFGFMAKGERYKTNSYPAILNIAHAVSNDEKRSMFRPLFLCPPISPYTKLTEVVFPGAHADVGGGYEDKNNELPSISLNWMTDLLGKHYTFPSKPKFIEANSQGLAHLSISNYKGRVGSDCRDRKLPKIDKDQSLTDRKNSGPVLLSICEQATHSGDPGQPCAKDLKVQGVYQTKETEQENINCDYIVKQKWATMKWN